MGQLLNLVQTKVGRCRFLPWEFTHSTYLALDKSCSSTSSSLRLLATLLLSLMAVVAMTEDKSRCGTGGGEIFVLDNEFTPLVKIMPSSGRICPPKFRSDVVLLSRCDDGSSEVGDLSEGPLLWPDPAGPSCSESWHTNSRSLSRPSKVLACMKDMTLGCCCYRHRLYLWAPPVRQ